MLSITLMLMKVGKYFRLPALLFAVLFVALVPLAALKLTDGITILPPAHAALTDAQIQDLAEQKCGSGTSKADVACRGGYKAGYEGSPSKSVKCDSYRTQEEKTKCGEGYEAGKAASSLSADTGDVTSNTTAGDPNSPDIAESDTGCGTDFDWVLCKIIRGAADTVGWIEKTIIEPFLDITPLLFTANPIYDIWKVMRDLANALFVVVFLVFIFAQTLSLNLDAYAIRKIIPKLVAAAILVQLSYLLSSLAIDIFNVIGHGLFLLTNNVIPPVSPSAPSTVGSNVQSFLNLGFLVGGAAALAVSAAISVSIVPVMIGIVCAALAVFFTLIFRQILVVLLIVTAPLAIVAWVLPSTEKLFKKWLDLFIRVLFMYPIIIMLFAAGKLFAASAYATNATFAPLFALVGIMVALFVIPMSFKFAGGIVSQISTFALKRGGSMGKKIGTGQWAKDRAEQKKQDAFLRYQTGNMKAFGRARARGMTGNLFPTATANRRLYKGYEDAEKKQIEAHTARIESDAKMKPSTLVDLASGIIQVPGYEKSRTVQMAAIKRLAKTNDAEHLRMARSNIASEQARLNMGMPAGSIHPEALGLDKMYDRAISSEFGDVNKIAPDLTAMPSKGPSLDNIANASPDKVSTFHKSTIDHFMQNANATQREKFFQSLVRLSGPAKGKMDPGTVQMIHQHAGNFANVGGTYADHAGNMVSAQQWIINNISNGRWN